MGENTGFSGNGPSANIVVIDDEEMVRFSLRKKLSKFGYNVIALDRAEDALYLIKSGEQKIDFVITDIRLRKMDGIELLRHVSMLETPVPVLLTGQGNVDDAVKALRYGACDFIPKPLEVNEVASIIRGVLKRKQEEMIMFDFGQYVTYEKIELKLPADLDLGNMVSFQLASYLPGIGICNKATAENVSLCLREAISNAMFHGNLELSSDIRERDGIKAYNEEADRRKQDQVLGARRVTVRYELNPEYVEYIVQDEGRGFDATNLPDPRDPENFFKKSGRGILIIKIHMDEVEWNSTGNTIRMRKYKVQ